MVCKYITVCGKRTRTLARVANTLFAYRDNDILGDKTSTSALCVKQSTRSILAQVKGVKLDIPLVSIEEVAELSKDNYLELVGSGAMDDLDVLMSFR